MSNTNDIAEKIKRNFDTFRGLCEKLGDRSDAVLKMVDFFETRLAIAPASSKIQYHNAFVGGLVAHSLSVLSYTSKLIKLYEYNNIPKESVIISTLFHDFGKIGNRSHDRYIEQKSSWHYERGEVYSIYPTDEYLSIPQMSLFLIQDFNIHLSFDEYQAILLNDGQYIEENKSYRLKESNLALALHQADVYCTKQEKGKTSL